MVKTLFRYFAPLLLLVSSTAWSKLEYDYKEGSGVPVLKIYVMNEINPKDYMGLVKLVNILQTKFSNNWGIFAVLDSNGGDVTTALQIGRLLRKQHALATVSENGVCLSSCVYILAGATTRTVVGRVGIHRPYDPNDSTLSAMAQQEKYQKIGQQVVAYLHEMNIPARLYEESLFISPEEIKMLTAGELDAFGLSRNDPYQDEANAVRRSKSLGISREEYAARELKARRQCKLKETLVNFAREDILSTMDCRDAVLNGR